MNDVYATLEAGNPYRVGETQVTHVGDVYRVEHGLNGQRPPLTRDYKDVEQALRCFAYFRRRQCTSCGQPGCAEDLVGKASIRLHLGRTPPAE